MCSYQKDLKMSDEFYEAFYKFNMTEKWYPLNRKKGAVFTQLNNEPNFFPIWLKHYSKYYDSNDIYVLNHNSTGEFADLLNSESKKGKFNLIPLHNDKWFSSIWMCMNYSLFQRFLLQSYESVLCCDCDEIIDVVPDSLFGNLKNYYENFPTLHVATHGFHVSSDPLNDPPIDIEKPILQQRTKWCYDHFMHKPLLTRVPMDYNIGQHSVNNSEIFIDPNLIMFHLHYIELDWIYEKNNKRKLDNWEQCDIKNNFTAHNYPSEREEKINEFMNLYKKSTEIPQQLRHMI